MAVGASPRLCASPRLNSPKRALADTHACHQGLERAFSDLRIQDVELQKLHAYQRKVHNEEADLRESVLAKEHNIALEKAQQDRESLRQEAEAVLQRYLQEQEAERRRQEEEEQLRQREEALAKAEKERKIREEQERIARAEREAKEADEQRKAEEKARAEQAEKERQQKEEDREKANQAKQQAAAQQRAQQQAEQEAVAQAEAQQAQQAARAEADSPEQIHQEYQTLYAKLKKWKNDFWNGLRQAAKAQKQPIIKEAAGDARRLIKSEIGKLSGDKDVNRIAINKLKEALKSLLASPAPIVGKYIPVNELLPRSFNLNDNDQQKITDQAAYFLCVVAQECCKIFMNYAHGAPERAEPVGLMISSLFSILEITYERQPTSPTNKPQRQSLITILLAKYHHVCPPLFGTTADQTTTAGKAKLGWARNPPATEGQPKTTFVNEQKQYDRITGLAIGYSSFSLRNFSGMTKAANPYPPTHFWRTLAQLVNMPSNQIQPIHVLIMRHIFGHGGIGRFILFFGSVGIAVLRQALIEWPQHFPPELKRDTFCKELEVFVENVGEKEGLHFS